MDNKLYDEKTWEALESFHRVWSRVSGPPLPTKQTDALGDLLHRLRLLHRHYAALSEHFSGDACTKLRDMARETALHLRRLQAEFYIREGTLWKAPKKTLPKERRALLRSAVILEKSIAELCTHPEAATFRDMGSAAAIRAETAQKILVLCF